MVIFGIIIFVTVLEYRAYREELAAYDDFVASLDMDD